MLWFGLFKTHRSPELHLQTKGWSCGFFQSSSSWAPQPADIIRRGQLASCCPEEEWKLSKPWQPVPGISYRISGTANPQPEHPWRGSEVGSPFPKSGIWGGLSSVEVSPSFTTWCVLSEKGKTTKFRLEDGDTARQLGVCPRFYWEIPGGKSQLLPSY